MANTNDSSNAHPDLAGFGNTLLLGPSGESKSTLLGRLMLACVFPLWDAEIA